MRDDEQQRLESIASMLTRAEELQTKDPDGAVMLRAVALEWLSSLRDSGTTS